MNNERENPSCTEEVNEDSLRHERKRRRSQCVFLVFLIATIISFVVVSKVEIGVWYVVSGGIAMACALVTLVVFMKGSGFWVVKPRSNTDSDAPESSQAKTHFIAFFVEKLIDWIKHQDTQTIATPESKLLAVIGVYLGCVLVLAPVCITWLPADWPYPIPFALVAGVGVILIDLYLMSKKKWPSAIRTARTFFTGIIRGALHVAVGLFVALSFCGALFDGKKESEEERAQRAVEALGGGGGWGQSSRSPIPYRPSTNRLRDQVTMQNKQRRHQATLKYWHTTICPFQEMPLIPDPSPDQTLGDAFEQGLSPARLEKIEQASRNIEEVDKDVVAMTERHLEEHRQAMKTFRTLFLPAIEMDPSVSMEEASKRANTTFQQLAAIYDQPVEPGTSFLDLIAAEAERSGNEDYRRAVAEIYEVIDVVDRQLCEGYELRGRLRERYACQEFLLPWDEQYEEEAKKAVKYTGFSLILRPSLSLPRP